MGGPRSLWSSASTWGGVTVFLVGRGLECALCQPRVFWMGSSCWLPGCGWGEVCGGKRVEGWVGPPEPGGTAVEGEDPNRLALVST